MATKWKNIIKAFLLRIRGNERLFLGLILECAGAAFLFWIYWRVFYYGVYIPTKEMWQYGAVVNLFMAMGVFFILRWVLKRIYKIGCLRMTPSMKRGKKSGGSSRSCLRPYLFRHCCYHIWRSTISSTAITTRIICPLAISSLLPFCCSTVSVSSALFPS